MARKSSTILLCPYDIRQDFCSINPATSENIGWLRNSFSAMRAILVMFSVPVSQGKRLSSCKTRQLPLVVGILRDWSGRRLPERSLRRVVFPHPEAPLKTTIFESVCSSKSLKTARPLYEYDSPSIVIRLVSVLPV